MTIHWKALEEHFLMVLLVLRLNCLVGNGEFSELFSKTHRILIGNKWINPLESRYHVILTVEVLTIYGLRFF
jgi:hypothetical protein